MSTTVWEIFGGGLTFLVSFQSEIRSIPNQVPDGTSLMEELVLLSPNNKPLFQLVESEKLYGLMLYTLGNCVVKKPEFSELGWYLIEIAVETGHPDAAIELAQLEQHSRDKIAPFKAWAVVKSLVEKGEDWRALVLYAARLVQKQTTTADRQLAYSLTQKAFRMTRPSNVLDGDLTDSSLTTWRPLQKSASDSWNRHGLLAARKDLDMAIRAGALDYQDPLACLWLARSPETLKYSKEWLELMTKAAMAGRGSSKPESTDYQQNAAEELGKYYLELHGWYPCQNGPSSQRGSSVGFDWLHVGAQQHAGKPEHMVYPYLKMASVMKENGYHQEGCKMLEQGRREIKQTWADEKQKESAAAQLQHYIDRWDQPLPADALPSFLLGDPCLHSRGYQNEATG